MTTQSSPVCAAAWAATQPGGSDTSSSQKSDVPAGRELDAAIARLAAIGLRLGDVAHRRERAARSASTTPLVPSDEPLSTTITSNGGAPTCAASDASARLR